MPRIRTIKPEMWQDEKLAPLAPIDRLVFIGLISMADDDGRMLDNCKAIDGFIFPESGDSSRESIETLSRIGRVLRYTSSSGQKLLQIVHWSKHQKVDNKAKYTLPAPTPEDVAGQGVKGRRSRTSRESIETLSKASRSDLRPTTYDPRPTTTDQRPSSCSEPSHATASEPDVVMEFVCVGGERRGVVTAHQLTQWTDTYPGVDVMGELRKMRSWLDANQEKRKTAKGLPRFIVMWLGKAQDRSGGSHGGPSNQSRKMSAGEITQQNIDKMLGRVA